MPEKPSYEELEQRVKELEKESIELKKAEKALLESEGRFRRLVEHATDAFFLHDFDGRIIDVNQHACESLGYTREELLALSIQDIDLDFFPGKHLIKWEQLVPGEPITFEGVHRRKNGTTFPVEVRLGVHESGERKLMLGLVRDITKRKQTEEALKEANQSLEEMVYISSHDLQVPLISMEGYASELLRDYKNQLDEDGVYCLSRLKQNAQRMHKLVISLLDISRLNTKKYPYESFNPAKIINNITQDLSLTIEKSNVQIEVREMPEIYGDKKRIEDVFRNLVTNAINYGGKNINIGCKDGAYYVKDDGIGIQENQIEKIFKP